MIKVFAVCEAFRVPSLYVRWRLMARNNPDMDITLFGPIKFIDRDWSEAAEKSADRIEEDRFRVIPINMTPNAGQKNGFTSSELVTYIKTEKPEIIYLIGFEVTNLIYQVKWANLRYNRKGKILAFSMRGLAFPNRLHFYLRWKLSCKCIDAFFCHYPEGKAIFKENGFKKPIFMQTQVGVDGKVYAPNETKRLALRKKYNILPEEVVFGTATRMEQAKGIYEVLLAFSKLKNGKLIMLGDGKEFEVLRQKLEELNLKDRVITPGYIPMGEAVSDYMNAMDCFIHFPKSTPEWIDTFPVAVTQAMAVGLPVIGSDSGAVPYQLGEKAPIVPEGNVQELHKQMQRLLENAEERKQLAEYCFDRVWNSFEIRHLNELFVPTIKAILNNEDVSPYFDQAVSIR